MKRFAKNFLLFATASGQASGSLKRLIGPPNIRPKQSYYREAFRDRLTRPGGSQGILPPHDHEGVLIIGPYLPKRVMANCDLLKHPMV
jgi:hypothetical protein